MASRALQEDDTVTVCPSVPSVLFWKQNIKVSRTLMAVQPKGEVYTNLFYFSKSQSTINTAISCFTITITLASHYNTMP